MTFRHIYTILKNFTRSFSSISNINGWDVLDVCLCNPVLAGCCLSRQYNLPAQFMAALASDQRASYVMLILSGFLVPLRCIYTCFGVFGDVMATDTTKHIVARVSSYLCKIIYRFYLVIT